MLIRTIVLDKTSSPVFRGKTEIDFDNLLTVAKTREELVRHKGSEWASNAVPAFARDLCEHLKSKDLGESLDKAAMNLALAAWLFDTIYRGLTIDDYVERELVFTIAHDGQVKFERVKGTKQ